MLIKKENYKDIRNTPPFLKRGKYVSPKIEIVVFFYTNEKRWIQLPCKVQTIKVPSHY